MHERYEGRPSWGVGAPRLPTGAHHMSTIADEFGKYTAEHREQIREVAKQAQHGEWQPPDDEYTPTTTEPEYSDTWAASRLQQRLGSTTCYVNEHRRWYVYNGTQWVADDDYTVERMAQSVAKQAYADAIFDGDKQRIGRAAALNYAKRIDAAVSLAKRHMSKSVLEFDSKPWLLNVRNGMLMLHHDVSFVAHQGNHTHGFHAMKQAPVLYDKDAECPTCDRFLLDIFGGDVELVDYFWRAFGYSLTGDMRESVMFICHGNGANGKSTLFNMIMHVLGDGYSMQAHSDTLLRNGHSNKDYNAATLIGKRFIATSETAEGEWLDENFVKQLTGGDKVVARVLYGMPFEFLPVGKIWMQTNNVPRIKSVDHGTWRRIKLIPFNQTFSAQSQDKRLGNKLKLESSGILNRAIAGCLAWQRDGLNAPASVDAATSDYRAEQDPLASFVNEQLIAGRSDDMTYQVSSGAVHSAYCAWAEAEGIRQPMTQTALTRSLRARGIATKHGMSGTVYVGVRLSAEAMRAFGGLHAVTNDTL